MPPALIWRKPLPARHMPLKSWTKSPRPGILGAMTRQDRHPCDPHGLIHEAYAIAGIGTEECRSIFFDWAIGLDSGLDTVAAAKTLHADLAGKNPDHPMSRLLAEAAQGALLGRRRRRRRSD
jgi:hypothetical protein